MKQFMLKLSSVVLLSLILGSSCMADYQDIKVVNNNGFDFKVEERHKKNGSFTDWKKKEIVKNDDSIKISMNLSEDYEYRIYSEIRKCELARHCGDAFKNKKKRTLLLYSE